jgi:DNA-binding NarL/FixJ family response regulator
VAEGVMTLPRLLVADADAPTRAGLRVALAAGGFEIVAEATDAEQAVSAALAAEFDAALVAAALPGGGIDVARQITTQRPRVRIVIVSDHPSGVELVDAVLAGASGYLGRDVSQHRLPTVLRAVLAGEVALPRRHTHYLLETLRGRDVRRAIVAAHAKEPLSDREWEVLQLLTDGAPTAEIARRLRISAVTVRRHVSSMCAKLGVPDRAGAVALLQRVGRR